MRNAPPLLFSDFKLAFPIMVWLYGEKERVTLKDLEYHFAAHETTIKHSLDPLVHYGFVELKPCPEDKRVRGFYQLTPSGRQAAKCISDCLRVVDRLASKT